MVGGGIEGDVVHGVEIGCAFWQGGKEKVKSAIFKALKWANLIVQLFKHYLAVNHHKMPN